MKIKYCVRFFLGFLVSPAVPALIVYLLTLTSGSAWEAFQGGMFFLLIGYVVAVILGLPTHIILNKLNKKNLTHYAIGGAIIGAVAPTLILLPDIVQSWNTSREHAMAMLINGFPLAGACAGIVAGSCFWFLAVRKLGSNV